jgi:hypothetical protein
MDARIELIRWCERITERYVPPAPCEHPELRERLGCWLDRIMPGYFADVREHISARCGSETASRQDSCQWWVYGQWRTHWSGLDRKRPEGRWIAGPDHNLVRRVERVNGWER